MRIAIDCGHGENTAGKRSPALPFDVDYIKKGNCIKEHTANVKVGKYLAEELERCGFEIYKSAFGDEDIPIADRQKNINKAKCDYSISIHFNAYGDAKTFNDANGVEVFCHVNASYVKDSKEFANALLKRLLEGTPQKNRGVKTQGLGLCNCVAMGTKASVLVELGFMTNLYEVKLMGSEVFLKECAVELAKGICDYIGSKYVAETITSPTNPNESVTEGIGYVKILVNNLNIWNQPLWYDSAICGTVNKNEVFTVIEKVKANKGYMYRLKSGVYITTNEEYVKFYTK